VYQPMCFSQDRLYLTDAKGIIQAVDANTGAVLWKQEALKNRSPLGPVRVGGYVAVMDGMGYLYHLDPNTGKLLNLEKVTVKIAATPVRHENTLYLQSVGGQITAIDYAS
jgi:outer membrane protein assembly factor BamB